MLRSHPSSVLLSMLLLVAAAAASQLPEPAAAALGEKQSSHLVTTKARSLFLPETPLEQEERKGKKEEEHTRVLLDHPRSSVLSDAVMSARHVRRLHRFATAADKNPADGGK